MYPIALRTLRTKVGRNEIRGYKLRGLRGGERRVTRAALEASGLRRLPHGRAPAYRNSRPQLFDVSSPRRGASCGWSEPGRRC